MKRSGFALPAVLWVIVGVAAVALAGTVAARESIDTAQNRIDHARAAWRAEGCLEIARATIADGLADAERAGGIWQELDSLVAHAPEPRASGCEVGARAAGAAIDVNAASEEQMRRVFMALGARDVDADSLAGAILDLRFRDGPVTSLTQLWRVPGLHDLPGVDAVLGVEPGRVPISTAPLAVIASLPGIGPEALMRVAELRARGQQLPDVLALAASLSPGARADFVARYQDLVALVAIEPDAWIVTSEATEGTRGIRATIEVRLVRSATRAAVVRRRTW